MKANRQPKRTTLPFGLCAINTDTTFMANRDDGFGTNEYGRRIARDAAAEAGVTCDGKFFAHNLADARGLRDPTAWISGRDDVRKKCLEKGLWCEDLGVTPDVPNPLDKPYEVDPDIIEEDISDMEAAAGKPFTEQKRCDLKEELGTRYKGVM